MPAPRRPSPEAADALERLRVAAGQLERAARDRDALILEASRLGASRRLVAEHAGVTSGRVQQIVDAAQ